MDPERWQRLSPLLDSLFELPEPARARRLQELRDEDPALTAELEALIALEEERSDFLAEPLMPSRAGAQPGTEVGPYRLDRLLGEGGMGQVWLASRSDGLYQRRVALKLLRPGLTDTNLRLRFTRERQILARLAHPHIARLLDAGVTTEGLPYLALEYVDGEADHRLLPRPRRSAVATAAHVPAGLRRGQPRARQPDRASRPQAVEHPGDAGGRSAPARFRHRQAARQRSADGRTDPHRRTRLHPALRRARADPRRAGHHHDRRVFAGRGAVRTAHRPQALPAQARERCRLGRSDPCRRSAAAVANPAAPDRERHRTARTRSHARPAPACTHAQPAISTISC